ncbi:hypothetical protein FQN50_005878 [Emmonsiellopsis sp. PD_5]|nr:hypothetical protein FQN50_005878 [Emmonsiellopsis sp. PD_5]
MANLPSPGTRIVPIMANNSMSASAPAGNRSSSIGKCAVKGAIFTADELKLHCLEEAGLYAYPIAGDGNCLFSSLADQLYADPARHPEIRARVVDHMRSNFDYFLGFTSHIGGDRRAPRRAAAEAAKRRSTTIERASTPSAQRERLERNLNVMAALGTWGGSHEIQAFCQAFNLDVVVYRSSGVGHFQPETAGPDPDRKQVHIAYHDFRHYSSVRNADGPHVGLPNVPKRPLESDSEGPFKGRCTSFKDGKSATPESQSTTPDIQSHSATPDTQSQSATLDTQSQSTTLDAQSATSRSQSATLDTHSATTSESATLGTQSTTPDPQSSASHSQSAPPSSQSKNPPLDPTQLPWVITFVAESVPGSDEDAIRAMLHQYGTDIYAAITALLSKPHGTLPISTGNSDEPRTPRAGSHPLSRQAFGHFGSSSRSSSRHSTASKRSADDSDLEEGRSNGHVARKSRGRGRKRRMLEDVTVDILGHRDEVIKINVYDDKKKTVAESGGRSTRQTAADSDVKLSADAGQVNGSNAGDDNRSEGTLSPAASQGSRTIEPKVAVDADASSDEEADNPNDSDYVEEEEEE